MDFFIFDGICVRDYFYIMDFVYGYVFVFDVFIVFLF